MKLTVEILLWIIVIVGQSADAEHRKNDSSAMTPSTKLHYDLFLNYNKHAGPQRGRQGLEISNEPIVVELGIILNTLSINDDSQALEFTAWLILLWTDVHFSWDPQDYEKVTQINVDVDDIWTPPIILYANQYSSFLKAGTKIPANVYSSGTILWYPPIRGQVPCDMNLRKWPTDISSCVLRFGSLTSFQDHMDIRIITNEKNVSPEELLFSNYESDNKWNVVNITIDKDALYFDYKQPIIKIKVDLQRTTVRFMRYALHSTFVMIIVVLSSYGLPLNFRFLRLLFHVTCLVLMAMILYLFNYIVPTSGLVPFFVISYYGILLLTLLSLSFTIIMVFWFSMMSIEKESVGSRTSSVISQLYQATCSYPILQRYFSHTEDDTDWVHEELKAESEKIHVELNPSSMTVYLQSIAVLRLMNFTLFFLFFVAFFITFADLKTNFSLRAILGSN